MKKDKIRRGVRKVKKDKIMHGVRKVKKDKIRHGVRKLKINKIRSRNYCKSKSKRYKNNSKWELVYERLK